MNQDFALELTPGIARRLVEISKVCAVNLDQHIIDCSHGGLIDQSAFDPFSCPWSPKRQAITQFILDCGLRCAIPELEIYERNSLRHTILNAIHISGVRVVTVISSAPKAWNKALSGYKLDAMVVPPKNAFDRDANNTVACRDRYAGVLIVDWPVNIGDKMTTAICQDFPRTIMFNRSPDTQWWEMGCVLFPALPKMIANYTPTGIREFVMNPPIWKSSSVDDLAIFYNTYLPSKLGSYGYVESCHLPEDVDLEVMFGIELSK